MRRIELLSVRTSRYFAYAFGVFVFIVGIMLDALLIDVGTSRTLTLIFSNLLTGTACGIGLWLAARHEIRRRVNESYRLAVLDEMNHHVRNALQVMVLYSYSLEGDRAVELRKAVDRIQWSLTDVLPRISDAFMDVGRSEATPHASPRHSVPNALH